MYKVGTPTELLNALKALHLSTNNYLKSDSRSYEEIPDFHIEMTNDIHLTPAFCKSIKALYTFFKGTFDANGFMITSDAESLTPLFSSVYYSTINELSIDNLAGSRGLILAMDATKVELNSVSVTGDVRLTSPTGMYFNTAHQCTFNRCLLDAILTEPGASTINNTKMPVRKYLGGYVGSDVGSVFNGCNLTGKFITEVNVGGFVAFGKNTTFIDCQIEDFTIEGLRCLSPFCSEARGDIVVVNCKLENVLVKGKVFIGFVVGKSNSDIGVDGLVVLKSIIKAVGTGSYFGGISGRTKSLTILNTRFKGVLIKGHFVLASLTPDLDKAEVRGCEFNLDIEAAGYPPMKTCVYSLVRDKYLGLSEEAIEFINVDNVVNVSISEASGGNVNPFREG